MNSRRCRKPHDRLLATALTAHWTYRDEEVDFGPGWRAVRAALLEAFANHDSLSVQHTLHAMGQAVLDTIDAVQQHHARDAEPASPADRPDADSASRTATRSSWPPKSRTG